MYRLSSKTTRDTEKSCLERKKKKKTAGVGDSLRVQGQVYLDNRGRNVFGNKVTRVFTTVVVHQFLGGGSKVSSSRSPCHSLKNISGSA